MLSKPSGKSFEELLLERGILTKKKLHELLAKVNSEKKVIEQLLLEAGFSEERITDIKAEYLNNKYVDLSTHPRPALSLLKHIKPAYAKNYKILPLKFENNILTLAMVEPRDFMSLDEVIRLYRDLNFRIKEVKIVITTTKQLSEAIDRFYASGAEGTGIDSILNRVEKNLRPEIEVAEVSHEDTTENSSLIVMLANKIVEEAYKKRSSDIHLEPAINHLRVRYRIDGELKEVMQVPRYAQDALLTRFKIMSDMRIDEKRQPQDGRIDFMKYNPYLEVDLRVSTVPSSYGEDIVIRILDKKSSVLSLEMLGFSEHDIKLYKEALNAPYGTVLHVGPTGSGKTTALYSALKTLDTSGTKIVTAEDPVEYTLGGNIVQSNINPLAGFTFAKAIRAFMRHDPDIIFIGEIRDLETAKTAIEASLTGHFVFSTLHTNDAIGTVTRLIEMGIEPFLVADSLLLICAQRLVKKICPECIISYKITDEELNIIKGEISQGATLKKGKGCPSCEGTGYKGRTGIYEVLSMNSKIRSLLINNSSTTDELKKAALEGGMKTLRQDAVEKALAGIITLEEVVKNTLSEK